MFSRKVSDMSVPITDVDKIMSLELRVKRLEVDLATLRALFHGTGLPTYESIPYYLHPDYKIPEAK
jgi:hypothetical protein